MPVTAAADGAQRSGPQGDPKLFPQRDPIFPGGWVDLGGVGLNQRWGSACLCACLGAERWAEREAKKWGKELKENAA